MDSRDSGDGRDRTSASPKTPADASRDRDNHDENPFIAFRRYADEQISSFLHAMTGLPSSFFTPSNRDWLVFHDPELNNALGRWRQHSDEHTEEHHDSKEGGDSGRLSQRRHASHAFPSSVFDSVFDSPFGFGPAAFFRDFSHFSPFMFDFLAPSTTSAWPIPYLLFSPYSPLHLERLQQVRQHRASDHALIGLFAPLVSSSPSEKRETKEPQWREAFEDLMRLENGKEILDRDVAVTEKEKSGKDWLSGMISRGSLGEGWAHVRSSSDDGNDYFKYTYDHTRRDGDQEKGPEAPRGGFTELDLYDHFLHQVNGDLEDEEEPLAASPLMSIVLEERRRNRRDLEELQRHWREARDVFRRERESMEESESGLVPAKPSRQADRTDSALDVKEKATPAVPSPEDLSSRLVSTVTKTERRSLPDGTIRTKTTVHKRFADGREENYENEEVNDNNHHRPSSTGDSDSTKSGWFWKE